MPMKRQNKIDDELKNGESVDHFIDQIVQTVSRIEIFGLIHKR